MTKFKYQLVLILVLSLLVSWVGDARAEAQTQGQPVVRVVMFWLSTCGHCEYVINEILPPLKDQYADQFEVLLIELVTQEDVDRLYETASLAGIPANDVGVPFMLVGDRVLKGSDEIPQDLPGLIESHLANGGLDYPIYPTLVDYLPVQDEVQGPEAQITASGTTQEVSSTLVPEQISTTDLDDSAEENFSTGFTIALVVLIGMVLAVIYVIYALLKDREPGTSRSPAWMNWLIPLLALAGIGVAGYLTYVETTAVEAICGPLGDCNAVQNSPYARVFGVLPVGILGLLGYVAILAAWAIQKISTSRLADYARLAMLGMGIFGTIYSIYLTYLELWVIRAVCMWCISSAVLITLLMVISVYPAVEALDSLGEDE